MKHHFCSLLLVTETNPGTKWVGPKQDMNISRQGSLGVTLETSCCVC